MSDVIMRLAIAILFGLLTVLALTADAQRWPQSGSCTPCKCSLIDTDNELIRHVNCSNLNLTAIPLNLPDDVEVLDFSNNNLLSTNVQGIRKFPYLHSLSLANNDITTLDDSPFTKSSLLSTLTLTGNIIIKLTQNAFFGLRNLKTLHGLKINSAESQVFKQFPLRGELDLEIVSRQIPEQILDGLMVHSLNLTILKAPELPRNIFSFGSNTLKHLRLIGPKISKIDEDLLKDLTFLKIIFLCLPQLEILPERIFSKSQLSNLRSIHLYTIQILPQGIFSGLEHLVRLLIENTDELPQGRLFDSLVNLQILDLSKSFINIIPENWFSKLNNLVYLSLSQTSLRRLDSESFTGLTKLKTLDLSGNSLRLIPKDALTPLRNTLENLDLNENILKSIETNALGGMYSLKHLDLSDNKMSSLQNDMFCDLIRLTVLNMQENMLSSLPNEIFHHQQRLNKMNLASNLFRKFPHALLEVSGLLIHLDLSGNQISDFGYCLADKFPFLEFLSLDSNPLNCDCNTLKLKESHPNLHLEGKCDSPAEFENQYVSKVVMPARCKNFTCNLPSVAVFSTTPLLVTTPYDINPESIVYTEASLDGSFNPVLMTHAYPRTPLMSKVTDGNVTYIYIPRDEKDDDVKSLFSRIEFQAGVGGLGLVILIVVVVVAVFAKRRHSEKARYVIPQLGQKNYVV